MKNLKLFTAALFFGMTSLFASENIEDRKEIRDQVVDLFDGAKFEAEKDFKVDFTFTFNQKGEIVVLRVSSNREDIKDYIRKNVNYQKIENPGSQNQIYKMPIKVKLAS
jgi:hypothetical protein